MANASCVVSVNYLCQLNVVLEGKHDPKTTEVPAYMILLKMNKKNEPQYSCYIHIVHVAVSSQCLFGSHRSRFNIVSIN